MGRTTTAVFILHLILLYVLPFAASTQLALAAERHHKPGCSKRERDALLSFKQRLADPANLLSSWHGDDCCSRRGVGCDARTGHVVLLDLGPSICYGDSLPSLSGDVDPSLANLTHLIHLDLSLNSVTLERFLPSIGSLTHLVYLNLSDAINSPGKLPPQLGNLSSLRYLDLSSSEDLEIDNLQWLSGLSSLQLLDLSEISLDKVADWLTSINMVPTLAVIFVVNAEFKYKRDFELVDEMQKAWFYEEYGPKEVLKMGDFPLPILQQNQLLVQVRAAALNPIDFKRRQLAIFASGLPVVPGCDMAGIVADMAPGVSKFKVGEEVYGNIQDFNVPEKLKQLGTLAEYVAVEENLVALKPDNLSFEEAGSLPLALQTALEGFETANFQAGRSVFIVGGAGGVGTLVVQLAKHYFGASRVVATCSSSKVEFVKSLGADMVIDYTATKYEEITEKFDFVYDTIGESKNSFVVAKEDAPVVDITWPPTNPKAKFSSLTVRGDILERLRPYLESGKIKAVIDPTGPYHFNDVIEAFRYLETGRARGKVVVSSFPSSTSV